MCEMIAMPHEYSGPCVLWTPWDQQKWPDNQGIWIFQVSLYDKARFGSDGL